MTLPSSLLYSCLLLGVTDMALASDNSKVLMLDTRNLAAVKDYFGNGKDYSVTLAKDNNRAPLSDQFTICYSSFILGVHGTEFRFYRILTDDFEGGWLTTFAWADHWSRPMTKTLATVVNDVWYSPTGKYGSLNFNTWHHICVAIDLEREVISYVGEGVVLDELKVKDLRKGAPKSLDGRLIIDDAGMTSDNYMLGNFQVFNRKLSNEEMVSITAGKDCGRDGDYLAWKDMVWDVKGQINGWVNVTKEELCASKTFRFVNVNYGTFSHHKDFCAKMDMSRIPAPVDEPNMKDLLEYYRSVTMELKVDDKGKEHWAPHPGIGRCVFYWVAYQTVADSVWVDHYTQQPANYFNWYDLGKPDNNTLPGCCVYGEIYGDRGGRWTAHPGCHGWSGMCSMCEKPTQPILELRGLCRDSDLTSYFTPVNDEKGTLGYAGLSRTVSILYNASTLMWSTDNMGYSGVIATNPASLASGLLGTSEWTVYNDSRKCSLTSSYKILLTLTACHNDQFTCVDGMCIPMERRFSDD